jgi:uncharacterized alpha-E superfamily protein
MLSRLSINAFWMSRYLERTENQARLVAAVHQLSLMPEYAATPAAPWVEALAVTGQLADLVKIRGSVTAGTAAEWFLLDRENPQCLVNCLRAARDNARSQRHLLTDSYWDALNLSWLEAQALDHETLERRGVDDLANWAVGRCQLARGAADDLLRDTLPAVMAMATAVERADHQGRLLAAFLRGDLADPGHVPVPGTPPHRRWEALLAATSLDETYRRAHTAVLVPEKILRLVLAHPTSPRSVLLNLRRVGEAAATAFGGDLRPGLAAATAAAEAHVSGFSDDAVISSHLGMYLLELLRRTDAVAAAMAAALVE